MQDFDPRDFAMNAEFRFRRRRPPIFVANAFYLVNVIGMVLTSVIVAVLMLTTSMGAQAAERLASVFLYIPIMALPIIFYAVRNPGVGLSMRLTPMTLPMTLIAAAAALVCYFLADYLGTLWMVMLQMLGGTLTPNIASIPTTQAELMLSIILVGVLPGVCEELLFRGIVLGAWERRGRKTALAVSSLLFALMHGSFSMLPVHILCGFVIGYLVLAADSIYVGMVFHTLYNALSMIFAYLYQPDPTYYAQIYSNLYQYVGGTPGILQLLLQILLFGAVLLGLLYAMNACRKRTPPDIIIPDKSPLGWREIILMMAGLVTVGAIYGMDLLAICGVNI